MQSQHLWVLRHRSFKMSRCLPVLNVTSTGGVFLPFPATYRHPVYRFVFIVWDIGFREGVGEGMGLRYLKLGPFFNNSAFLCL